MLRFVWAGLEGGCLFEVGGLSVWRLECRVVCVKKRRAFPSSRVQLWVYVLGFPVGGLGPWVGVRSMWRGGLERGLLA